jgi:hypothetical protein
VSGLCGGSTAVSEFRPTRLQYTTVTFSVLFLVVHAVECGTHGKRGSLFFVRTFELLRW